MTFLANTLPNHFLSFRALLLCLIILALPTFFYYGAFASSLTRKQGSEATALLTWKASLHNQSQTLLSSWVGSNHCSWVGIGCNKADRVAYIDLHGYGLKGTLSNLKFSSFPHLLTLRLFNNSLYGTIPSQIGSLWRLTYLILSLNNLSGTIPTEIGQLTNLRILYMSRNQISGSIPQQIGLLNSLNEIGLHTNNLMGSIPFSIGNLGNLTTLHLYDNQLSGSIPQDIEMLRSLVDLELSRNNLTDDGAVIRLGLDDGAVIRLGLDDGAVNRLSHGLSRLGGGPERPTEWPNSECRRPGKWPCQNSHRSPSGLHKGYTGKSVIRGEPDSFGRSEECVENSIDGVCKSEDSTVEERMNERINNFGNTSAYPEMHRPDLYHEPFGNGARPRGPVPPLYVDRQEPFEHGY
ncbi:hypothetical protein TEA_004858 [Camellia sinensis var. sinensis]|uniref:Uncharacterized protein n=1 Tax=Camellia sinensis var. sinensis TaxID=542762 RepID=A0A4S4EK88_CAMSN|nr:hypothetical protein TEA_004858 [Camellia sinensis var. sinensis]